jgi:tricorn protease interacting factor F2/3
MLESFIGEDAFRKGISEYLKRFQYENASGEDLWRILEQTSNQPIHQIMNAWISKLGHPVIKVKHEADRVKLEQTRFLMNGNQHATWPIPLNLTVNGKPIKLIFDKETLDIPLTEKLTSFHINPGQTGFYRTHYSPETYTIIKRQIHSYDKIDRWGVIRDTFALLLAGNINLQNYFELVNELLGEEEYLVADTLSKQLTLLYLIAPSHKEIASIFRRFHSQQVERLGLNKRPNEDEKNRMLRERVVYNLALIDEKVSKDLALMFNDYDEVDPDIRGAVALAFALTRGSTGYDALYGKMKKVESNVDKVRILQALVSFKDAEAVRRTLDLLLSGEINLGDVAGAVMRAARNPHSREAVWNWLPQHIDDLHRIYQDSVYMSRIMEETIPMLGLGRMDELRKELASRSIPEAERGIKKGLELLEIYSSLLTRL